MRFDTTILKPGDLLLYFSRDVLDWLIAVKTWTKVAHCEFYRGGNISYASRNGIGVNKYFLRTEGLAAVVRPKSPLDFQAIDAWFAGCVGQKYDWLGLLCFTLAVKQGSLKKQFCSEVLTRILRAGRAEPFNPGWDADRVPPSFFLVTSAGETIWSNGDLF